MLRCALMFICLAGTVGCGGGGGSPAGGGGEPAVAEGGMKKVAADKLPELGDYGPDLDDGKVTTAPPKGWRVMTGRTKSYISAFTSAPVGGSIPMIIIAAEATPAVGFDTLTEENVEGFAEQMHAMLENKYKDKLDKNVTEFPKAMILGGIPYVRYVKNFRKKDDNTSYQSQVLATNNAGRMYTIELHVTSGNIKADRDFAYAVAAGLKFKSASKKADEPKVAEKKEEEKKEEGK